jgi:LPS O-antigen subunit length determinant protein (WzzB/FepE family)
MRKRFSGFPVKSLLVAQNLTHASGLELSAMAATEGRLQSMAGELSFVWDEYRQCWDSLQRAKTSAALDSDRISNVVVVQPATYPAAPIKPNKRLNLALGLVVGLGAGLGLALLREFMDETLKSERDVEGRLRVPVLASIPAKEFEQCR